MSVQVQVPTAIECEKRVRGGRLHSIFHRAHDLSIGQEILASADIHRGSIGLKDGFRIVGNVPSK